MPPLVVFISKIYFKNNGYTTTRLTETQRIIKHYYEHLYGLKLDNPDEMVELHTNTRITNTGRNENLNRPLINKEIDSVINTSQQGKA